MVFTPSLHDRQPHTATQWIFLFKKGSLLVTTDGPPSVPCLKSAEAAALTSQEFHQFGVLDNAACICAEATDTTAYDSMEFRELRGLYGLMDSGMFRAAGMALQVVNWDQAHRFCGQCGSAMVTHPTEFAKRCPQCGFLNYPRISPAIIVAIVKDKHILLARRKDWDMFSVIAGYVEAGEDLEETVKREVKEEVGLDVTDIVYFGSQPWPYSGSLMIGFTAKWCGGEITPDGVEIDEARWFTADALPKIPSPQSISRRLINWFVETYK